MYASGLTFGGCGKISRLADPVGQLVADWVLRQLSGPTLTLSRADFAGARAQVEARMDTTRPRLGGQAGTLTLTVLPEGERVLGRPGSPPPTCPTTRARRSATRPKKTLASLFGGMAGDFKASREALGYTDLPSGQPSDPAEIGVRAADNVIASRTGDNSNQANNYADTSGYVPGTSTTVIPSLRWVPLAGQGFSTAHWRTVTPFAPTSASQFRPGGPGISGGGTSYENAVRDIVEISGWLNDNAKARALFWWDGAGTETPPGHYHLFVQAASRKRANSLDTDTKLFFALGNAALDASIAAWDAKWHWDFLRPITAVRRQYAGVQIKSWNGTIDGANFSGAAAEVLTRLLGSDDFGARVTIPAGKTVPGSGPGPTTVITIGLTKWSEMAIDSGNSRNWAGIHFVDANRHGVEVGRKVGRNALDKASSYWS